MKRKRNVSQSTIFCEIFYKFYLVIGEAHDLTSKIYNIVINKLQYKTKVQGA